MIIIILNTRNGNYYHKKILASKKTSKLLEKNDNNYNNLFFYVKHKYLYICARIMQSTLKRLKRANLMDFIFFILTIFFIKKISAKINSRWGKSREQKNRIAAVTLRNSTCFTLLPFYIFIRKTTPRTNYTC